MRPRYQAGRLESPLLFDRLTTTTLSEHVIYFINAGKRLGEFSNRISLSERTTHLLFGGMAGGMACLFGTMLGLFAKIDSTSKEINNKIDVKVDKLSEDLNNKIDALGLRLIKGTLENRGYGKLGKEQESCFLLSEELYIFYTIPTVSIKTSWILSGNTMFTQPQDSFS